jgi:hypothetical protein
MKKTKKSKAVRKSVRKPKNPDSFHIKKLILFTERQIKNDGSDLDSLFMGQLSRLKKQLG